MQRVMSQWLVRAVGEMRTYLISLWAFFVCAKVEATVVIAVEGDNSSAGLIVLIYSAEHKVVWPGTGL